MSILIFLLVLFVLVLVHEWGHYITAKLTGMRVDEFGIGFPPKLFGVKRGETEYTFNLFPIGGFVKIFGEDGITDPNAVSTAQPDYSRSFTAQRRWAQALVLVAGVTMNVVFAWVLFSGAYLIGVDQVVEDSAAGASARLIVSNVLPESPAAQAAIPQGVTIVSVSRGDASLTEFTPSGFSTFVSESEVPVNVAYLVGEEIRIAAVEPTAGVIESDPNRKAIGVGLALVDQVRYGIIDAIVAGGRDTIENTKAVALGIVTLVHDSILGRADLSQVAGPVGIVGLVGEASAFGFAALLTFTAFISLNLAVINLLPFPALDGGRLLFVIVEAATRRSIPARVAQVLNTAGFAILILLMVIVTWNDVARLI